MSENISTETARIRALSTSMVSLLESERDGTILAEQVERGANLLVEAYQDIFNCGSKELVREHFEGVGKTFRTVDAAYTDWRDIDSAFRNALRSAYSGETSPENLLLDTVHSELRSQIGEPIASLNAKVHAVWNDHVTASPWDSFLAAQARNADSEEFESQLKMLVHGDHLDVEDAVTDLTGTLRHEFIGRLEKRSETFDLIEESLWMRPEIVVMNDYWRGSPTVRIVDTLTRKGKSSVTGAFAQIQDFFSAGNTNGDIRAARRVVNTLKTVYSDDRETYLRCLMLHPDQDVRHYAINNVDIEGFWKVVTPETVPCATILSMLQKVAGSHNYDENFQKVFFHTIHRRLVSLTSKSDVIYARGIVRILAQLPFLMEDTYFEKLTNVIDYISAKEKLYKLDGGMLEDYVEQMRSEKDRIGTLKTQTASLSAIPPVALRKLARDGHFWNELASHPLFKIARETIPHIHTPERAMKMANTHTANSDVLRAVGKRRALFNTLSARLALLSNPHTPPTVSMGYVMDLTRTDVEGLLRKSTLHPELRQRLRQRLNL